MKRLFSYIALVALPIVMMAQGWPANYGGVMLQGFYWDSYDYTKWANLESRADELGDLFDLIWVPNSGRVGGNSSAQEMGYCPMYWLSHNTVFGNETALRSMIETYRAHGTGIMMDLVLNHKNGTDWVRFPTEKVTGKVSGRRFEIEWDNVNFSQICRDDECNANGHPTTGAADTGEGFDGARDLDHTNITTQQNIRTYMDYLQNELGYVGYRLDETKGYSPSFTGKYNNWNHPLFSVGEYWDGNSDVLRGWLDGTLWAGQKQSAVFDFCLKYRINDAFINNNWDALNDKGLAADVSYNRWAVTFIDNHDTGREGNHSRMSNDNNVAAANAFILAMPGTPCIFSQHYENNKTAITNCIKGRRAAGITNQSPILVQEPSNGGYIIEVQGTAGKVYLQLGGATGNGTPSGYQLVQAGTNYRFFITSGLNWKNSKKIGGGVPPSVLPTEVPTVNKITIFVKADDQSSTHLYAWDKNDNYIDAKWPGVPVRTLPFTMVAGAKWYYKTFDQNPVNVIFNNGTGGEGNQTADIKNLTSSAFFTYSGTDYTKYENVTTAVTPYIGYEVPDVATPIAGHYYCYLETNAYTTPYIYTWDNTGKQHTGAWPGTAMTQVGTAPTGNKLWRWEATSETQTPDYVVFNNGSTTAGKQTDDMDFVSGGYYTLYGLLGTVPEVVEVAGDVDGNGEVDGNDLNMLINIILGSLSATDATVKGNPNIDGEGGIDGNDLNNLINIILGK